MAKRAAKLDATREAIRLWRPSWYREDEGIILGLAYLERFLLPMHVIALRGGKLLPDTLTGFLVRRDQQVYWVTAAHAIDNLVALEAQGQLKLVDVRLWDGLRKDEGGCITISIDEVRQASRTERHHDVVAIPLRTFTVAQIAANPHTEPYDWSLAARYTDVPWEGMCVLGFPSELQATFTDDTPGERQVGYMHRYACLPASEVPDAILEGTEPAFWGIPGCMYARLESTPERWEQIDSISGMSGGPVFALGRTKQGRLWYRILGVQSAWLPQSRIVRIANIEHLFD